MSTPQYPTFCLVSEHIWQNLEPRQQQWLRSAAEASATYQKALWKQASDEALAAVKAAGVEIIVPDKTPFQEAVKSLHESYSDTPAGSLLNFIGEMP